MNLDKVFRSACHAVVCVTAAGWRSYHIALEFIRSKGLLEEFRRFERNYKRGNDDELP